MLKRGDGTYGSWHILDAHDGRRIYSVALDMMPTPPRSQVPDPYGVVILRSGSNHIALGRPYAREVALAILELTATPLERLAILAEIEGNTR